MIKPEIAKIIREVDENHCIGNHELVAKVAEKYAEQRQETASEVDTIVIRLEKDVATKLKEKADWEGMTETEYLEALMQKTPFVFSH